MMLSDAVAAALPELRAHAESRMSDRCRITRGDGAPVWDEATGTYLPSEVLVYEGPCRVKLSGAGPMQEDAQGQLLASQKPSLHLPFTADAGLLPGGLPGPEVLPSEGSEADVRVGDVAVLTTSVNDPSSIGLQMTVDGRFVQTDATARRFPVRIHSQGIR